MTPESPVVAANAVVAAALPLDQFSLLGLFSGPNGNAALLRTPRGDVLRVIVGDRTNGLTVVAMDDSVLQVVDARGQSIAMRMPAH